MTTKTRAGMLVAIPLLLCGVVTASAQQFDLTVPDNPRLNSSATLVRDVLTIADSRRQRFDYTRRPRIDSPDGRYLGFYSEAAGQYIRWPKIGSGAMYIGTSDGRSIVWKASRMRVATVGRPLGDPKRATVPTHVGPMHLNAVANGLGTYTIGHIDDRGLLRFYAGKPGSWRHRQAAFRQTLVPGAPVALVNDRSRDLPIVYSFNARGQLLEVVGDRSRSVTTRTDPSFIRNTQLSAVTRRGSTYIFAIDDQGRLWELDVERGRHRMIERRGGLFEPGAALTAIPSTTDQVYLVDRRGNLLQYQTDGGVWSTPRLIGTGFVSGANVTAREIRRRGANAPVVHLAGVDAFGRLRIFERQGRTWADQRVSDALLPPGTPVGLAQSNGQLRISAVGSDGRWVQWQDNGQGLWNEQVIGSGFPIGAPIVLHPSDPQGFAIDRGSRVVAGHYLDNQWRCEICSPQFDLAPRLVDRRIKPNPPLEPATILLRNPHREDLVVRIFDARQPNRPIETKIPAGGAVEQRIDRDSGATLEEVYLIPGPLGSVGEKVFQYPLPPKKLYDVVVYADRVQSIYFDRTTNKGPVPDEVQKSLTSLGVFPILPGNQIRSGEEIDVFRAAASQGNPGAVRLYD